ncbi:MAG: GDSL-type esterase/lipase family protein [Planctomycetaceae bacterium]
MKSLVIQHIVGGDVFFVGCGLILLALLLSNRPMGRWGWSRLLMFGVLGVILSATPSPGWFYGLWAVSGLAFVVLRPKSTPSTKSVESAEVTELPAQPRWWSTPWLACGMTIAAVLLELPYHFSPGISQWPERIIVLGDSISAGIDDNSSRTWPNLLASSTGIEVLDLSRSAATVGSTNEFMEERANDEPLGPGLVLIELGGNDVLGGTSVGEYEHQLDQLLSQVTPGHQVLMFELPLPPTYNRFGSVQRRLAAQYNVQLIPKSIFARLLISPETTLDSIHLSPAGHARFAAVVANLLK